MPRTTFHLIAVQRFGDPDLGVVISRLNPGTVLPELGDDIVLPTADDLLGADRRLGGVTLPPDDPETAAVFAAYALKRR